MTFAPETTSMSASSWCGYSARPRRLDHPANASKTASGSGVAGSRSVSVMAAGRREKGEGRREKGEGRREKGEGRREKGEGRREKGEGRREKGEGRREKGEG